MLTGKPFNARRAKAVGLVDRLARPDELLAEARDLARRPSQRPFALRAKAWATNTLPARAILAPMVRKQTAAKVRKEHYPAPFALIDVWARGGGSIQQRLKLEAKSVAKLATTSTARNLIRIFFLQERLKGLGGGTDHGIKHVHVVGAGTMGGDIAAWSALKGFEVTLQDRELRFVEPAIKRARALFEKKLRAPAKVEAAAARGCARTSRARASPMPTSPSRPSSRTRKPSTRSMPPSNRSSSPTRSSPAIRRPFRWTNSAQGLKAPQRFLGLHFFNPVAQMPLVEVVRHDALDPAIEKRALAFCKAIGKLPVPVKGTPGFLVNRILMPYLMEAMRLYNEGVPGPVLDREAKKFGMPMGPIELADTVGLDVCASVGKELAPFLGLEIPQGLEDRLAANKRGKKDGEGLYVWKDGKPDKPEVDPDYVPPPDIQDRMILPMINEAIACLAENVVDDADLLDAGVIFGTGFAPFRGGPIQYVRSEGVAAVRERLAKLEQKHGARFAKKEGWENPELTAPAATDEGWRLFSTRNFVRARSIRR